MNDDLCVLYYLYIFFIQSLYLVAWLYNNLICAVAVVLGVVSLEVCDGMHDCV